MSSVIQVGTKWRAQVRRKNFKPQTKTFESKKEAEAWARSLEVAIDKGGKPSDAGSVRLAYVIKEYRQLRRDGGREAKDSADDDGKFSIGLRISVSDGAPAKLKVRCRISKMITDWLYPNGGVQRRLETRWKSPVIRYAMRTNRC